MSKQRIDMLLVDRGLAESPEKARALVMAGQVLAAARPVSKPGMLVEETASLEVARGPRYVSRGGEKLEHALNSFGIDVSGLVCADIGSSTGGFTDCLLQAGASRVYAVDVGKGQLDYGLRQDPRVVVMEGVNVRAPGRPAGGCRFRDCRCFVHFVADRVAGCAGVVAGFRHCDCRVVQAAIRGSEGRGAAGRRDQATRGCMRR